MIGSTILTGLIRHYALMRNVLDIPNQRSSHSVPTPRGGGLAIVLVFTCAITILYIKNQINFFELAALSCGLPVAAIGFFDDHAPIAARWRFITHILAASSALFFLQGMPLLLIPTPLDGLLHRWIVHLDWLGYPLGLLLLVWFLNLFNFMDGIDGIAASESLFIASALAGYSYHIDQGLFFVCIGLAAASVGFLVWNWPKASIFMGDVGSGFLGLLLGVLMLLAARQAAVMLYCGLILFGVFLVDATYTLVYRFLSKQSWHEAHCSHAYQHAAKRYGHFKVLCGCWLINLFWLLPISLLVFLHPAYALFGVLLAFLPLWYLVFHFKAGHADWAYK
jgi:Fuc2NAc and GlcNAc transferase